MFIIVILLFLILVGIALIEWGQKRSLSSWFIEKLFDYRKYKLAKKPDDYQGIETQRQRKVPYHLENPQAFIGYETKEEIIDDMQVFIVNDQGDANQEVIYYLYGSVYLRRPEKLHFKTLKYLIQLTNAKVVFPNFHKAPNATYKEVYPKLVEAYMRFCLPNGAERVNFVGDSSGGGMALALAQYLRDHLAGPQPKQVIMLSPWLDVSFANQDYKKWESVEAYLDARRLRDIGELWAGSKEEMQSPYVSPLYGNYQGLPKMTTFVGTKEIFYPDILTLHDRLSEANVANELIIAPQMIHAYAIFPIREAQKAQKRMAELIKSPA